MIREDIIHEINEINLETVKIIAKDINYMIKNSTEISEEMFKKYYIASEIIDHIDYLDVMCITDKCDDNETGEDDEWGDDDTYIVPFI